MILSTALSLAGFLYDSHLTLYLTVVRMASFQLTTRLGYKFTEEVSIKARFSLTLLQDSSVLGL